MFPTNSNIILKYSPAIGQFPTKTAQDFRFITLQDRHTAGLRVHLLCLNRGNHCNWKIVK